MQQRLPTPQEMIAHLDLHVQGQDAAKRILAKAVYFHYLNLVLVESGKPRLLHEHCLVLGPTGSGKSLLVKTLGAYLGVPVLFTNAANLTSEGYVGESVGDMLARLCAFCGHNGFRLSRAILFLDELDKLAMTKDGGDIRTVMVQQELLAALDGNRLTRDGKGTSTPSYDVDTSKLLIIGAGAFSGIDEIAGKRLGSGAIGFKRAAVDRADHVGYGNVVPDDLVIYGFQPEFVARFTNIVPLEKLTECEFRTILDNPMQSPFATYAELFRIHGVLLTVAESAKGALARRAAEEDQGARSLRRAVSAILQSLDWQLAELSTKGCREVIVTAEMVNDGAPPTLVLSEVPIPSEVEELRSAVFRDPTVSPPASPGRSESPRPTEITNTRGWTDEQLRARLAIVKEKIDWAETKDSSRKWWLAFENENQHRLGLVVRLAEELERRRATITEFFLAYVYSNTDNIQANLEFLDFSRVSNRLIKSNRGIAQRPGSGRSEPVEELGAIRAKIGYAEASSRARFLYRCIEEGLSMERGALDAFAKHLSEHQGATLDTLFATAVLAQVYEPEALFSYLAFFELHIAERSKKDGTAWYRSVYLENFEPSETEALESAQFMAVQFRDLARRFLLRSLAESHPVVASHFVDDWTLYSDIVPSGEAFQIHLPPSMREATAQIAAMTSGLTSYAGQVKRWRCELRRPVLKSILPALAEVALDSGSLESLKSRLEGLSKAVRYLDDAADWARTLCDVVVEDVGANPSRVGVAEIRLQTVGTAFPALAKEVEEHFRKLRG